MRFPVQQRLPGCQPLRRRLRQPHEAAAARGQQQSAVAGGHRHGLLQARVRRPAVQTAAQLFQPAVRDLEASRKRRTYATALYNNTHTFTYIYIYNIIDHAAIRIPQLYMIFEGNEEGASSIFEMSQASAGPRSSQTAAAELFASAV